MIHIVEHPGLNGQFLKICKWVSQFGPCKLTRLNETPSITSGIILIIDLPIRPESGYRVKHPISEFGQLEATQLKEFFLDNINVPVLSFGSFSLGEMKGVKLHFQSSRARTRMLLGTEGKEEYWFKGQYTEIPIELPEKAEILATYLNKEKEIGSPLAFSIDNVVCCNTQPYKFENVENSHYRKVFGYEIGDPISNGIMKVYEQSV